MTLALAPQNCASLPLVGRAGVGGGAADSPRASIRHSSPLPRPLPMRGRGGAKPSEAIDP